MAKVTLFVILLEAEIEIECCCSCFSSNKSIRACVRMSPAPTSAWILSSSAEVKNFLVNFLFILRLCDSNTTSK